MKKQILKSISLVCLLSFIFHLNSKAQIVYTDLNPDTTITTGTIDGVKTCRLDLNNDGTVDFKIQAIRGHHLYVGLTLQVVVTPLNTSAVSDSLSGNGEYYPLALDLNSNVGSNLLWKQGPNQILKFRNYGFWLSNTDAYLGLKVIAGSDIYYGWVRLSIQTNGTGNGTAISFTVKDYAYNSISNQPILAGETNCTTPTVNLTVSGSLSFCAGDSVTLTANGTGYQYQWKKNGANISGAISQTYIAKTAGIYKCKVTNSCGSKASGAKRVTVPCRMPNENFVESLEHLSVFPNPANNSVTIKFHSDSDEDAEPGEVQIINPFGEIIFSENINTEQMQIDVSNFSAGMYVLRWNSGEKIETKMFSIVR